MNIKAITDYIMIDIMNIPKDNDSNVIVIGNKPKFMIGKVVSHGQDIKTPISIDDVLMFTPGDVKIMKINRNKHVCFIKEDAIIGVFTE